MLDEQSVYMGGGSEGRQLVVDFPLTESFSFLSEEKVLALFHIFQHTPLYNHLAANVHGRPSSERGSSLQPCLERAAVQYH